MNQSLQYQLMQGRGAQSQQDMMIAQQGLYGSQLRYYQTLQQASMYGGGMGMGMGGYGMGSLGYGGGMGMGGGGILGLWL